MRTFYLYISQEGDNESGYKSEDFMKLADMALKLDESLEWSINNEPPNYEDEWFLDIDGENLPNEVRQKK